MKASLNTTTKIALALALAAVASIGCVSQAQEKPIPPPEPPPAAVVPAENPAPAPVAASDSVLPSNVAPDSPTGQVLKLVQAGVEIGVINNFIANTTSRFNLDAETVITLNDAGVPPAVINSMLEHDKKIQTTASAPEPAPAPAAAVAVETAPPAAPVTVNYFYENLSPYGAWVEVDGYGRCWRPTVVTYDVSWRPYCDRGRWVWTDHGWYWDSDYSWGATFHYGRWFRHARWGWCWYPDTVWGPSWVTFRSCNDYYGWAPLPPRAVFRPGVGFFYRDAHVAIGFDFGLDADCFTFVSPDRFCDRRPRDYCAPRDRVRTVFNQTTVINNYGNNNTIVVNNGIAVEQVNRGRNRPIEPVRVGSLPNAGRQGWRGDNDHRDGNAQHGDRGNNNNRAGQNRPDGDRPGGGRNQVNTGGDRGRDSESVQLPQNNNQTGRGPANGGPSARQGSGQPSGNEHASENNNNRGNREGRGNGDRAQSPGNNQAAGNQPGGQRLAPVATTPLVIPPRDNNTSTRQNDGRSNPNPVAGSTRNDNSNRNQVNHDAPRLNPSTVAPALRDNTPRLNPSMVVTPPAVSRPSAPDRQIQRDPVQQHSAPFPSERSVAPSENRQIRSQSEPAISSPVSRPPQVEQRQVAAPVQRDQVVERRSEQRQVTAPVQREQPQMERRVEQRSEPVVRSTPSPAPSQSRSADSSSSRSSSSSRDSERRSGRDKDK